MGWVNEDDKPVVLPFTGINNISEPTRLKPGQCVDICNLDVGDDGSLSPRAGYTILKTADTVVNNVTVPGTAITGVTSGWSNDTVSYCVYDQNICSFDGTTMTPLVGTPSTVVDPDTEIPSIVYADIPTVLPVVEFVQVNDVIVYSDGVVTGVIENGYISVFETPITLSYDEDVEDHVADNLPVAMGATVTDDNTDPFEFTTPGGKCLDFYNGHLFFAVDNFIYCTEAFDIEHVDIRANVVGGYADDITMIKHVGDGLYVGTEKETHFITGTNLESGFESRKLADKGVIYGTAIHVQSDIVPALQSKGIAVIWASPLGIFAGTNSGQYINLSLNTVALPDGTYGCATFVEEAGQYKYITCYTSTSGAFANRYEDAIEGGTTTGTAQAWAVNTITGGHSRYTSFPFTSFFRFEGDLYGTTTSGLAKMNSSTTGVEAFAITASLDFGQRNLKYLHDLYLSARCSGNLAVNLIVDEVEIEGDYVLNFCNHTGIHQRRAKLPKGIKGTYWQFKVKNVDAEAYTITEMSMTPIVSQRISR